MMLAIAIILGVNVTGTVLFKFDFNPFSGAALVMSLFTLNTVLAIIVLSVLSFIFAMVVIRESLK